MAAGAKIDDILLVIDDEGMVAMPRICHVTGAARHSRLDAVRIATGDQHHRRAIDLQDGCGSERIPSALSLDEFMLPGDLPVRYPRRRHSHQYAR